jgi:hypothetical protein
MAKSGTVLGRNTMGYLRINQILGEENTTGFSINVFADFGDTANCDISFDFWVCYLHMFVKLPFGRKRPQPRHAIIQNK